MPRLRSDSWRRSTSGRIALLQAALLAVAIGGAGLGGWLTTRGLAERDARDRITLEIDAMAREIATEGRRAAIDAVMARAERPGALEYRLETETGTVLAGDLATPTDKLWSVIDVSDETPGFEGKQRLLVRRQAMPDGSILTVGDDLGRGEALRDRLFRSFLAWGLVSLILGLTAGLVLNRRALSRMDRLVGAVSAVADGDLSTRAPLRSLPASRRDDIDQLSQGINDMLDRLELLVAAVGRVSADVAHDLRTPLFHVQQQLEAAENAATPDARRRAISAAGQGVSSALRVFEAMLRLAAIDAGEARRRFSPVDPNEVADRVVDAYRPEVEASGLTLTLKSSSTMQVYGDADLIAQALANLIENSLKHSGPAARIAVKIEDAADAVRLSVADDGPGIPADKVDLALRPFSRLDASRSSPGTGLGLPIAGAVARLHGGTLVLEDADPGLKATMTVPAYQTNFTRKDRPAFLKATL